eukprot:TRINITY_DN1968_c0_g1_i1.p1 TRINITY_DN1968_c0_g1~~TRINITY_DN1968_c0_g1_i1.p1  ORF type:complete len:1116 (-),score=67.58 TRINITY_DN1968_c0_g1_i1:9726-12992(-)
MSYYPLYLPLFSPLNSVQCLTTDPYSDEPLEMRVYLKLLSDQERKPLVYKNLRKIYEVFSYSKIESYTRPPKIHITDFPDPVLLKIIRLLSYHDLLTLSKTCRYFFALLLTHLHMQYFTQYKGFPPYYLCKIPSLHCFAKKPFPSATTALFKELLFCARICLFQLHIIGHNYSARLPLVLNKIRDKADAYRNLINTCLLQQNPKNAVLLDRAELTEFVRKRVIRMKFCDFPNPLSIAVEFNSKESLEFFFQHGGKVRANVKGSLNAVQLAIKTRDLETLQMVLENSKNKLEELEAKVETSPSVYAVEHDKLNALEILVEKYKEMSVKIQGIEMALTSACAKNYTKIAGYLQEIGANPNQILYKGISPLMACCKYGCYDMLISLLNHPLIEVNLQSKSGKTALHFACKYATIEYIEALYKKGADPSIASTYSGKTALYVALERGNENIIKAVLKKCNIGAFRKMTTFGVTAWTLAMLYILITIFNRKFRRKKLLKVIRRIREGLEEKDYVKRAAPYHPGVPEPLLRVERKISPKRPATFPYNFKALKVKRRKRASICLTSNLKPLFDPVKQKMGYENKVRINKTVVDIFQYKTKVTGTDLVAEKIEDIEELCSVVKHNVIANQRRIIGSIRKSNEVPILSGRHIQIDPRIKRIDNADIPLGAREKVHSGNMQVWDESKLKKQHDYIKEKLKEIKNDKSQKVSKALQKAAQESMQLLKNIVTLRQNDPLAYNMVFPFIKPHLQRIATILGREPPSPIRPRPVTSQALIRPVSDQIQTNLSPQPLLALQKATEKQKVNVSAEIKSVSIKALSLQKPSKSQTLIEIKPLTFYSRQTSPKISARKSVHQKETPNDWRVNDKKIQSQESSPVFRVKIQHRYTQNNNSLPKTEKRRTSSPKPLPKKQTELLESPLKRTSSAIRLEGKIVVSRNTRTSYSTLRKTQKSQAQTPFRDAYTLAVSNNLAPAKLGPANLLVSPISHKPKILKNRLYSLEPIQMQKIGQKPLINNSKPLPYLKPCNLYKICNTKHLKYLFTKKFVKKYGEDLINYDGDGYEYPMIHGAGFSPNKSPYQPLYNFLSNYYILNIKIADGDNG